MKAALLKKLIIPTDIFACLLIACSFSASSAFSLDTTKPVLAEVTPIISPTSDITPIYKFSSTEAGTIIYSGDCTSFTNVADIGINSITFNPLTKGMHKNCKIVVKDASGNSSVALSIQPFSVAKLVVYPSLGIVKNAIVKVFKNDGITLLAEKSSGERGIVGVNFNGYSGPVVIQVIGNDKATYYDESALTMLPYPASHSLHALYHTFKGNVAVTPLTEFAYQIALKKDLFPLSVREVDLINERIRSELAPELQARITFRSAIFKSTMTTGSLDNSLQGRYALHLAALAGLGSGQARPALAVSAALSKDILDGSINDKDANGTTLSVPYDSLTFANDMNSQLNAFAQQFGSAELIAAVANYPAIDNTIALDNLSGKEIFDATCSRCHAPGTPGLTPEIGDKQAWASHISKGIDVLYANTISGVRAPESIMPPMGDCKTCTTESIKLAVDYIVEKSQ